MQNKRIHAILYIRTVGLLAGMAVGWDGKNHAMEAASFDWREVTCLACREARKQSVLRPRSLRGRLAKLEEIDA